MKYIVSYLNENKNIWNITKPERENVMLDVYTDTYFTKLFESKDKEYPVRIKVRTGVIITFEGIHIL